MKTKTEWKLYRDEKGYPRKTRSGHYRFDLVIKREDGTPFASVTGLRLDYDRRRILPVQITVNGKSTITVAEIAPECHQLVADAICSTIAESFGWRDEAPRGPISKPHKMGCREFHLYKVEDCPCQKPNWVVPPIPT